MTVLSSRPQHARQQYVLIAVRSVGPCLAATARAYLVAAVGVEAIFEKEGQPYAVSATGARAQRRRGAWDKSWSGPIHVATVARGGLVTRANGSFLAAGAELRHAAARRARVSTECHGWGWDGASQCALGRRRRTGWRPTQKHQSTLPVRAQSLTRANGSPLAAGAELRHAAARRARVSTECHRGGWDGASQCALGRRRRTGEGNPKGINQRCHLARVATKAARTARGPRSQSPRCRWPAASRRRCQGAPSPSSSVVCESLFARAGGVAMYLY